MSLRAKYGLLVKVVSGREFVVANEHHESGQHLMLSIINTDGSQHLVMSNTQKIRDKDEAGEFRWFEPPRIELPNVFSIVFSLMSDNSLFHLDIDVFNGNVVGICPMQ